MTREKSHIVLADGTVFEGFAAGHRPDSGISEGEFVFNTAMSGYQEVITDPSYAGQVIAFTYPHLGNYGVNSLDEESSRPWCHGVVCRDLVELPSSWRADGPLESYLADRGVAVITGVDTRRLTRHLRSAGALAGVFGPAPLEELAARAPHARGTDGRDLVSEVSTSETYHAGDDGPRIVAIDYGIKTSMVRQLAQRFKVTVVSSKVSVAEIDELAPDGIFLSNGPGDPAALRDEVNVISGVLGRYPIFGICLGHQLLATALGATTYKLPFGHHGSNHPVKDLSTGRIEITAQNHNYAVAADSLPGVDVTHVNLNDGVIEGVASAAQRCFSVQYHPEASPGPHDARYLFSRFDDLVRDGARVTR